MQHSIFAFEICARFEPNAPLHDNLRRLVTSHPTNASLQQKWAFYRQVVGTLRAGVPMFERGCWDYFDNDAKALADYEQWVGGMVSEEGARTQPSGNDPYRGGQKYMTFTMAFLLVQGSPTDMAVRRLCDVAEANLWRRDTFARILDGLSVLNFASIKSDVAYLIPRDTGWGLTLDDLAQPKFHYLRPIV
ncbi:MAG: hypothetical protein JST00_19675 [Deltaproteobacteria bacterium]|nr:hypothetical protein [Deltaproteobacteria bacterium]